MENAAKASSKSRSSLDVEQMWEVFKMKTTSVNLYEEELRCRMIMMENEKATVVCI